MSAVRNVRAKLWRVAHRPPARGRLAVGAAGLLASLAIHLVLIQAMIWSGGTAVASHVREGFGANAFGAADEAVTTLFFIEDADAPPSQPELMANLASAGKVLQSLHVTILSTDPSVDSALRSLDEREIEPPSEDESAGEREARAALLGRYLGQMRARIERAWARPRTAIGADLFECRVQVLQNARGEVQEVTLQTCSGDTRWQMSLVQAVERASPLPAPPDPSVFAESLQLSFQSAGYVPGESNEGFEPDISLSAKTSGRAGARDADQIVRPR